MGNPPPPRTAQQKMLALLPHLTTYAPRVGVRVIVYYEEGAPRAVPYAGEIVGIDEEGMHVKFDDGSGTFVVDDTDTWEFDRMADLEYLREGMLKLSQNGGRETLLGILKQEKFSKFVTFGGGDGVGETEIEIDYAGRIKSRRLLLADASKWIRMDMRQSELWWQEFNTDLVLHKELLDTLRKAID